MGVVPVEEALLEVLEEDDVELDRVVVPVLSDCSEPGSGANGSLLPAATAVTRTFVASSVTCASTASVTGACLSTGPVCGAAEPPVNSM